MGTSLGTLLRFLFGGRRAILDLAADRRALWAGLLFVMAAGLAREYDGVDLTRQPWLLLVPPAASLAVSFVLFVLVYVTTVHRWAVRDGTPAPPFGAAYRSFLALFWLTGPLAFLYAIPYERFLAPGPATAANLWTLGVVALWRVQLISRVLAILTGRGAVAMFFVVMLVADAAVLIALFTAPIPVIDFMGGVRLTDRESILQQTALLTGTFSFLTAPVWLIGAPLALYVGRAHWQVPPEPPPGSPLRGKGLIVLATASVVAFALLLPFTQPEQRLRTRVERDLRAGRLAEALETMSAHEPGDFPPHWDPPPRPAYDQNRPPLVDVLDVIAAHGAADWVRDVYLGKLERTYLHHGYYYRVDDGEAGNDTWSRVERLLDTLPEGPALRREHTRHIVQVREAFERRSKDAAKEAAAKDAAKGAPPAKGTAPAPTP